MSTTALNGTWAADVSGRHLRVPAPTPLPMTAPPNLRVPFASFVIRTASVRPPTWRRAPPTSSNADDVGQPLLVLPCYIIGREHMSDSLCLTGRKAYRRVARMPMQTESHRGAAGRLKKEILEAKFRSWAPPLPPEVAALNR